MCVASVVHTTWRERVNLEWNSMPQADPELYVMLGGCLTSSPLVAPLQRVVHVAVSVADDVLPILPTEIVNL
jgi:hypothetical protein